MSPTISVYDIIPLYMDRPPASYLVGLAAAVISEEIGKGFSACYTSPPHPAFRWRVIIMNQGMMGVDSWFRGTWLSYPAFLSRKGRSDLYRGETPHCFQYQVRYCLFPESSHGMGIFPVRRAVQQEVDVESGYGLSIWSDEKRTVIHGLCPSHTYTALAGCSSSLEQGTFNHQWGGRHVQTKKLLFEVNTNNKTPTTWTERVFQGSTVPEGFILS
ncbi:uncharacterized protein B0H64DRAFT_146220 [Chaetomium fimeti]|uniref:Uncharacterized protein n=1 Tax=Chaetomium fimeti TaxID=1854472 RepID=A0AAE0HFH9_9PEZI|nr:hypothetical protein B0H64DRAFT_146220 [Chaetomium fimeti]